MTLDDDLLPKRRDKVNWAQVYVVVAVMLFCAGGVYYTGGIRRAFYVAATAYSIFLIYKLNNPSGRI